VSPRDRQSSDADRARVTALRTASGARVELMRTSFRTQVFPRHAHDYFTLGVGLRGVGALWYRGATRTRCRGDVVVIPPGEVHTGGLARGTDVLSYLAVHLPADVLAECAEAAGFRGGRAPDLAGPVIRDPLLAAELRRLDAAARDGDSAAADDALSTALGMLVRRHADATFSPPKGPSTVTEPDIVRIAREVIEDGYADNARTSLRALAEHAGCTPYHLVRVFTRTVGLSPHRFLVQTRVRRAGQLLSRGIPSSFAAAMTGFVDQSHLITQFKRYVGTTPAAYQRCVVSGVRGR
jgi:AraC-like DNA-binding protein/quercetin dioxygenase-like cupin family protein